MRLEKQIDTIVHIGAGRCGEWEEYKNAGARRIVLIEPDPEIARYLRENFGGIEDIQVIEKAVTASSGPVKLNIYNVRGFSSLREPTGLRDLFPGLRRVDEVSPEMWMPKQMCEELGIDSHKFNWLIVDAPGEEGAILENLREEGLLERFEMVSLYAGVSALYEGNLPAEKILSELGEMGYEETAMDGEAEPERPRWTLYRDEAKIRNRELEVKLNDAIKMREEKATKVIKLKSKLENTEKRLDEEKNRAATLHEEKTNAQSKNTELQNTINKLKDQLKKAQSENAELKSRQSMTQEEMRKAEGQIDLIKELLLRERG